MPAPFWKYERENVIKMLKADPSGQSVMAHYSISRKYLLWMCKEYSIPLEKKPKRSHASSRNDEPRADDLPKWLIEKRSKVMVSMPFGAICK